VESLTEIRKRRLSLGLSLGDLARSVGRSDATISRIERGQIQPSYELVQRILSHLEELEARASPPLRARDVMTTTVRTVDGGASVGDASEIMEKGGFSQLPVLDNGQITGAVSEATILRVLAQPHGRRTKIREVQEDSYPQVEEDFPAEILATVLTRYPAVLIVHRGAIQGIVTRSDLIRGLRGTPLRRSGPAATGSR
jgi:predicted transcriptional regulator